MRLWEVLETIKNDKSMPIIKTKEYYHAVVGPECYAVFDPNISLLPTNKPDKGFKDMMWTQLLNEEVNHQEVIDGRLLIEVTLSEDDW